MENAKSELKNQYALAIDAYEAGNFSVFLTQLRLSIEWLGRIVVYEEVGETQGKELLSGKINKIYGTDIHDYGKSVESSALISVIPKILVATNKYARIPKDQRSRAKRTIELACDGLVEAYGICSNIANHSSSHKMNVKLQAQNYSALLPAFIDKMGNYGIISNGVLTWLQTAVTPIEINHAEYEQELERLKKDLEEATQKYAQLSIEAQKQINSKNEIINAQTEARNAAEERALKAQRDAFEAERREEEGKNAYSGEKKQLLELIEDLKRQLEAVSTQPLQSVEPIEETKAWDIEEEQMDEDQHDLIEENLTQSMLVAGCAGSGKSIIALHKAKQVIEAGYSVYLIAYTKSLRSFMDEGRKDQLLRPHCCYYHQWKYDKKMAKADYIIVDEIQDFTKEEILEFMHAANKCFFFFGDTAQSIFHFEDRPTLPVQREKGYSGETIEDITGLTAWQLYNNYRLPKGVAKITQQYIGVKVPPYRDRVYKSEEETIPHFLGYQNEAERLEAIKRLIKSERFHNVGIFLPTNDMVFDLYTKLTQDGYNVECKYSLGTDSFITLDFRTNLPKIMTYHSAKGLQFETVILPYCQPIPIEDESARKALYVAMTRTYKELYMMYIGDMPSPLNKVDKALYSTTTY